ncbi:MAG: glycoside hydrolase family 127 protein [Clostridia bacterium]|nr:glycoside hydrolase family 127 protein [Clostridia bacterium]
MIKAFDLNKVQLWDGIFKDSQEIGKKYLLDLEVDRLLAPCYEAAGRTPKAPRYGGWESMGISGHALGHWMSASAAMYAATGDKALKERLDYAVVELGELQDKDGYVSGFPRECFDKVFSGDFSAAAFELAGHWVPWYSIHKIYAGLIDAYLFAENQQALDVVCRLADWAKRGTDLLSDELMVKMLITEHGGMNEVFASLYEITKNEDYFNLAVRFSDDSILKPLSQFCDELEGKHANTQIPKIIGAMKIYEQNYAFAEYKDASGFFWDTVTKHRSYVFGGNSNFEHFGKLDTEPLSTQTCETCNSYNMLKLSRMLFLQEQDSKYFEFYENALLNHILASQDPETGMKTYFMATTPGHFKVYCSPYDSFWCCTGTGMENPALYGRDIYYCDDDSLYVNLFISSRLDWSEKGFIILQKTKFPYEESSSIEILDGEGVFELKIREPEWTNVKVSVNGEDIGITDRKGGYVCIRRIWKKGDVIRYVMPMKISLYTAKDDKNAVSFRYGPIVLAGALGRENFPETDILKVHTSLDHHPRIKVPALVTDDKNIENWIRLVDKKTLTFETEAVGMPNNEVVRLLPFFALHHERYTLYWRLYTNSEYSNLSTHEREYEEKLANATVDIVRPNEQQPELDHNMKAENSICGYLSGADCGWRLAMPGGFFSYNMKVNPTEDNYLMVFYWGSDADFCQDGVWYRREFDIFANNIAIGTQKLNREHFDKLISKFYKIPKSVIRGETVEIKFVPKDERSAAGGVFGVRITREIVKRMSE